MWCRCQTSIKLAAAQVELIRAEFAVGQLFDTMGGPNLEIFKFSLYLFVPILALVHFGDPDWYRRNVVPVCGLCLWCLRFLLTL
jgi:hypothetical protein